MVAVKKYQAVARRDGRFWLVDVEGVGLTQGRNLQDARDMAADLVETMTGKPGDINFIVDLPAPLAAGLGKAKADIRQAEQALQQAAEEVRRVAAALRTTQGLTGKDVAFVLEVSEQRASQLLSTSKVRPKEPVRKTRLSKAS